MKKVEDPRHLKRIQKMQLLFANSFKEKPLGSKTSELKEIYSNQETIDKLITESAPQFPIDKIAKVDVAILRLAVYEMVIVKEVPFKVIIDEAVELAKEFGSETSSSFINGVLGSIHKKLENKSKNE